MLMSWPISDGIELPLMLCAGVGSVVAVVDIELAMLSDGSVEIGESWDGLCGV